MKKLLPFLLIIFFATNCSTRKKIQHDTLFIDLAQNYNIADYNIVIKTTDSVFYLSNAKVFTDGKIIADDTARPDNKNSIVLYSNVESKNLIEYVTDSTGNKTGEIKISKDGIKKVEINGDFQGSNKRIVYDENSDAKIISMIFIIVMAILTTVALVIYLIYLLIMAILDSLFGSCYIATMVYGSYDAPEVLVLRKFRDEKLAPYVMGRIFIRVYYTLSPGFVFLFKNNKPVNQFIKSILDRWVKRLREKDLVKG